MTYDLFICHASEDKTDFVEPLVEALTSRGLEVWYDAYEIQLGDDFRRKMDEGLAGSRFGVVVLSPSFRKFWPESELSALFNLERVFDEKRILPIAHGLTPHAITKASPLLAARAVAYSSEGMETLVDKICAAVEPSTPFGGRDSRGLNVRSQPFEAWKPVRPPFFEGRRKELYRLESALGRRDGVSIVGDGKIGKSSLLLTWQQKLKNSGRTVRFVDGQGVAGTSEAAFVTEVTGRPAPGRGRPGRGRAGCLGRGRAKGTGAGGAGRRARPLAGTIRPPLLRATAQSPRQDSSRGGLAA